MHYRLVSPLRFGFVNVLCNLYDVGDCEIPARHYLPVTSRVPALGCVIEYNYTAKLSHYRVRSDWLATRRLTITYLQVTGIFESHSSIANLNPLPALESVIENIRLYKPGAPNVSQLTGIRVVCCYMLCISVDY
ncbi:hypothetical protein J6590_093874 [Homalodisca vitripennis]|nr:hypothetical protein J6590_093874 [Homalodisca vitripennis]